LVVIIALLALGMGATVWGLRLRRLARNYAFQARLNQSKATQSLGWETIWRKSAHRIDQKPRFHDSYHAFGSPDDLTGEIIDREIWRSHIEAVETAARYGAEAAHYTALNRKYERAARYPWLTVEPDPPPPKWIASSASFGP
jgi:hypothetical protein